MRIATYTFLTLLLLCNIKAQATTFANKRLYDIAQAADIDCNHLSKLSFNGVPINVVSTDDYVLNIGYQIFSPWLKAPRHSAIYNFVERYALECELADCNRLKVNPYNFTHHISFSQGSRKVLPSLYGDSAVSVNIAILPSGMYRIDWCRNDTLVAEMSFPTNFELISGSNIIENESSMAAQLRDYSPREVAPFTPVAETLEPMGSSGILVMHGEQLGGSLLLSDRYFNPDGSLVYSPAFPRESFCNLLSGSDIDANLMANISMNRYGGNVDTFSMPLRSLIDYCLSHGCTPFTNVLNVDQASGTMSLLLKMVCRDLGFLHMIRAEARINDLFTPGASVDVTLTSYIPLSDNLP